MTTPDDEIGGTFGEAATVDQRVADDLEPRRGPPPVPRPDTADEGPELAGAAARRRLAVMHPAAAAAIAGDREGMRAAIRARPLTDS